MIDRVEIRLVAGNGGDGAISFRREKFVPYGGPDGGDGGGGGDVVIRADGSTDSLLRYRYKRLYRAGKGGNGRGSRRHGRNGRDIVLPVPEGTVVTDKTESDNVYSMADLEKAGTEVVAARGGSGGRGNTHYATSTNQAPHVAQRGEPGEERTVLLEMRLIADVGIIGYPNVGKSTLLAATSAATPKVASYPFTTIEPILGVVELDQDRFIMAEIPGLIEGAHRGKGLGHDFLQHMLRTRIIIHLVDGSSESPIEELVHINEELALYDQALAQKPQVIAVNKIDLPEVQGRLKAIKQEFATAGIKSSFISAATGQGVVELMREAAGALRAVTAVKEDKKPAGKVFRPKPRDAGVVINRVGDVYNVSIPGLERIITGPGASPAELRWQFNNQLTKLGVNKALEKAGVKPGSKIRCGELEWEW